jgi:hypothetical protein
MALRHPIQAEAPHLEAMVRQKCHGGDSAHAWYGHQAAAGRAFADHLKHHFMKYSALLPKGSAPTSMGRAPFSSTVQIAVVASETSKPT